MYIYEIRDLEFSFQIPKCFGCKGLKTLTLVVFFILSAAFSKAQFYEYGQDAASVKWNHFSSEHYKLIYPRGLDSLAMNFADKLEYYYPHQAKVMDHEHHLMPVVFHNEASISNGIFVWAPKRLEVFTNPDPNGFSEDWMTLLALHEGRHAFQVSKLNQGFSKALSFVAGEQAVGAITGFLPIWYLEGDAVDAETRFSYSGRGRLPSFEMGMKAILLEKDKDYSFSKALLGSYKDYIPNHYELGYLMVHYGRKTYGNSFWNDMEDYAARKPFLIVPTYFSMKKYGVKSKRKLYQSTMEFYGDHWAKTRESRTLTELKNWNIVEKNYTNYHFPQWMNDSTILVYKTGIDQIPEFVSLTADGSESRIFRPGYLNSGRFTYSNGILAWDEWVPDLRWSNRNYSLIKTYDFESGKVNQLGSKTRYYSPALSHSGKEIAVVEQGVNYTFKLQVMDLNGKVLHSSASPKNFFIQQPCWMENDTAIVVTLNTPNGEFLYSYSLISGNWESIYDSGFTDISNPLVSGSSIYFSSTHTGIDNIFCYNIKSKSLQQISSVEFGAFEPSLSATGNELLFAEYHSDGYRAVSMPLSLQDLPKLNERKNTGEQIDADITPSESEIIKNAGEIQAGNYNPKKYNKALHSINIHSWLPMYFDYMNPEAAQSPEEFPLSPGATVLTQNLLSTVTGMLAYEYKDKTHFMHTGVRLKGKYPIFDLSFDYGGQPSVYKIHQTDEPALQPNRRTFLANSYIPFRLNTGKYISVFQPYLAYSYTSDLLPNADRSDYESGLHKMHYRVYLSSYLRMGTKDILPRLGFSLYAGIRNVPFNSGNFGNALYSGFSLYVPGILKHQSLKLQYRIQHQNPKRYFIGNSIELPRGLEGVTGFDMQVYSADYTFPLFYPDLNIEPLLYIKRVRGNLWADYFQGKDIYMLDSGTGPEDMNFFSIGADLLLDINSLRIFAPFSIGLRLSYIPDTEILKPEFLFTIDVN